MSVPGSGEQHERAVEAAMSHRLTRDGHCPHCTPHGTIEEGPPGATWTVECEHGGIRQQAERYIDAYHRSLAEQGVRLVDLREVVEWLRAADHFGDHKVLINALERRFGGHEGSEAKVARVESGDGLDSSHARTPQTARLALARPRLASAEAPADAGPAAR